MANPFLRVVPLGGLGEIGKNMMALECDGDIIVIDAGVMFPEEGMPGIDVVIPVDFSQSRDLRRLPCPLNKRFPKYSRHTLLFPKYVANYPGIPGWQHPLG